MTPMTPTNEPKNPFQTAESSGGKKYRPQGLEKHLLRKYGNNSTSIMWWMNIHTPFTYQCIIKGSPRRCKEHSSPLLPHETRRVKTEHYHKCRESPMRYINTHHSPQETKRVKTEHCHMCRRKGSPMKIYRHSPPKQHRYCQNSGSLNENRHDRSLYIEDDQTTDNKMTSGRHHKKIRRTIDTNKKAAHCICAN